MTARDLRPDCGACQGLCCVALPFTRSADFPESKAAGVPCRNLLADHRCAIHPRLREQGWVGCTVFGCYGAGQRVSQETFGGRSWRTEPELVAAMTAALPVVHQLHEMLWYLTDPAVPASRHEGSARALAAEIDALAGGTPAELAALDVGAVRTRVGLLLRAVSEDVRGHLEMAGDAPRRPPRQVRPGADLVGARLARADLRCAPLRGALAIAADLRGADLRHADLLGTDLRDADLRGADLTDALFLTQPQADAAHGDATTRLPARLTPPGHWR